VGVAAPASQGGIQHHGQSPNKAGPTLLRAIPGGGVHRERGLSAAAIGQRQDT